MPTAPLSIVLANTALIVALGVLISFVLTLGIIKSRQLSARMVAFNDILLVELRDLRDAIGALRRQELEAIEVRVEKLITEMDRCLANLIKSLEST